MARLKRKYQAAELGKVIALWANKSVENYYDLETPNAFTSKDAVYSYGYHYALIRRLEDPDGAEFFIINDRGYSSTTSKHISEAWRYLRYERKVVYGGASPYGNERESLDMSAVLHGNLTKQNIGFEPSDLPAICHRVYLAHGKDPETFAKRVDVELKRAIGNQSLPRSETGLVTFIHLRKMLGYFQATEEACKALEDKGKALLGKSNLEALEVLRTGILKKMPKDLMEGRDSVVKHIKMDAWRRTCPEEWASMAPLLVHSKITYVSTAAEEYLSGGS